ncbi:MAG: type II secretion system F family protein [Candidatus Diapherotrites archaeon]
MRLEINALIEKISRDKKRLHKGAKYAAVAVIFFWLGFSLLSEGVLEGLLFSAAVFFLFLAVWLYLPFAAESKKAKLLEKDLPFALMSLSVELNLGIQFEKALENIANSGHGSASTEFRKVMADIRLHGASVQEALFALSARHNSLSIKRAIAQLVNAYEQGGKSNAGEPVKRLASEHLSRQRAEAKEFSGKLMVFSLMFIAVSAIIPAIFLAYMIVGSSFMEIEFKPIEVLLISAIGFPLIDCAVLLFIRAKTPIFLQ